MTAPHDTRPDLPEASAFPRWDGWSLAAQFAVAGGVVMLLAMIVVGFWVSRRIEDSVVRNTANATALYMESFISPLSQDLADTDTISPGARRALEEIFTGTALGARVVSYKIWKQDGLVVEASDKTLIGQRFEPTDSLRLAWTGEVRAEFEDLGDHEDAGENALGLPLLEIYSPIREVWSGRVIGVAEFYEVAQDLKHDLTQARWRSWLAVALVMMLIGASLFAIVMRGSRTIDRQLVALTALSDRNTALRLRVQQAAARASAMNDQALRRIGADLHDGPAQLMSFAALRLDSLKTAVDGPARAEFETVERAVKDAIREVRSISRGLSLPDIEARAACDLIRSVAETHAARTGTEVQVKCSLPDAIALPAAVKICLYRFVQEGLTNAWRHAEGAGQEVAADLASGRLTVTVCDRGPGTASGALAHHDDTGMGLAGLRDRVESLGGFLTIGARSGGGTELTMVVEVAAG